MTKLFSATEILAMKLPNLPTTKKGLLNRAEKEEWFYETKIGLGGVRKLYKIPAFYLPGYVPPNHDAKSLSERQDIQIEQRAESWASEVVNSNPQAGIDQERLRDAIQMVNTYLRDHKMHVSAQKHAEVVTIVYDFMQGNREKAAVDNLIKHVA